MYGLRWVYLLIVHHFGYMKYHWTGRAFNKMVIYGLEKLFRGIMTLPSGFLYIPTLSLLVEEQQLLANAPGCKNYLLK